MDLFAIPIEDKLILYRPLRRLAFVGNRAMADLVLDLTRRDAAAGTAEKPAVSSAAWHDAAAFVDAIGFLEPDPAPPSEPSAIYRPTTAVLLLTNRCNLRCTYCYASGGEGQPQDLSPALARAVIDRAHQNAAELGSPFSELTFHGGGEPVQAWGLLQEATAHARSKELPCRISLVSNGVFTDRQLQWVLDNLDNVTISFDGRKETQDRQRPHASGHGSFESVMRTIRALDEAGSSYGIRMTATAPWRGQLAEDVRFICEETRCPAMQVEPAFNTRRGEHAGPTRAQSEAFIDAFMEAFEVARVAGRQLTYSGARPWLLTRTFCMAPHTAYIVNPAGQLVSCYEVTGGNHPLSEISTVGEVADGRVVVDHQAQGALWDYLKEQKSACRDCFCYWHCAGDCYTRAFSASSGESQGNSPRCTMNREITARILLWYIMNNDGIWQGQGEHPQAMQLMREF
jgi:uncharacterized protein